MCCLMGAIHPPQEAPPDLSGGSGCVILPREAVRRWRGAVVLPDESRSSIPQNATRLIFLTPLGMRCGSAAS